MYDLPRLVRDQGDSGASVAFAVVTATDSLYQRPPVPPLPPVFVYAVLRSGRDDPQAKDV